MNAAHLHLLLTHLPIVAVPVALVFLLHSFRSGSVATRRFAFVVLMVSALSAVPVYLTGEPAEEVVEHLPGVLESLIEKHEEAGEVAMVLSVITGVLALIGLLLDRTGSEGAALNRRVRLSRYAVVFSTVLTMGALAYTGNLGGQIRHTEIRSEAALVTGGAEEHPGEQTGNRDDD
jgi:formate hydrogenlyase subunit 3/multisubunit Na+/H+ antiporter MnhD subunit